MPEPERDGPTWFYSRILRLLTRRKIPFLVGGAYGLRFYTGIRRDTKDLDLFLLSDDCQRAMALLAESGHSVKWQSKIWLAKTYSDNHLVDLIFNSGNGLCPVDEQWFEHSSPGALWGIPVRFAPVEEMIWSKAFIMERDRYDGADIAHLIRLKGGSIDWERLLRRFAEHWPLLLSHLILFLYVYPDERSSLPRAILSRLMERVKEARVLNGTTQRLCRGTLLSRTEFVKDLEEGFFDGRLIPSGLLTSRQLRSAESL
ncbi:MAG: nucleotidyltransferase [Elusimicrobia bacterium]|nr:nucleotidyltransferase [Elusimicrobiota bacterium]